MKSAPLKWKLFLLLVSPLFIYGLCNKGEDELPTPTTDQYVTWKITGHSGNITNPPDNIGVAHPTGKTVLAGTNTTTGSDFYVNFTGANAAGTYPTSSFIVYVGGKYYIQKATATPLQVNVTTYGVTGQYIIGNYSGTLQDSTSSSTVAVSGEFRVKNQ